MTPRTLFAAGIISALCAGSALAQTAPAPAAPPPPAGAPGAQGAPMSQETMEALLPLDCSVTKVMSCKAESGCKEVANFGDVPLPAKVLVDPGRRIIAGVNTQGLPHISEVDLFSQTEYYLTLEGVDGQTGWMIHASRKDETMTFAVASHHTILTGFGTCKAVMQ